MASIQLHNEDILDWANRYNGEKFHALLTDSPYEYGFMGKSWDDTGVSFRPDTWAAILDHMLPGAFGMTYTGARTWHRIAVAIEDAGFVIHPSIFGWVYASGLHKAARIDTQIDKAAGVYDEREVIEKSSASYGYQRSGKRWTKDHFVTRPYTEEAMEWWHHRYGLQALRPAVEPVILFQRPYEEKPVDVIEEYGSGALAIEATKYTDDKKWPTNFYISHHPLCTKDRCYSSCNVLSMADKGDYFPNFGWEYDIVERGNIKYSPKAMSKERDAGLEEKNTHTTIKPLSVNMWLARMLLPPDRYTPRRILVPFAGVASEVVGSMLAGWDHITGVEITKEYYEIGKQRTGWWKEMYNVYGGNIEAIINHEDSDVIQVKMNL